MSLTTRSTPPDPPPLLFGRRSSSPRPRPFSSSLASNVPPPPSGQSGEISSELPVPPPPRSSETLRFAEEDVDMDVSTTLSPPVQGQNHDRGSTGDIESEAVNSQSAENPHEVVDTTVAGLSGTAHPRNENLVRVSSNGSSVDSSGDTTPPISTSRDEDSTLTVPPVRSSHGSPPPPPPPEDHEMSDGDYDHSSERWRPLPEDNSSPNETELKEIEDKVEHSAEDHEHWENQTFFDLQDPEHTPNTSGRIHWTVTNYNGTKEKPNHEVLMRSPIVNVGGYDWQIKFYPRGNDSEYLSVYIECVSFDTDAEKPSESITDAGHDDTQMEIIPDQPTSSGMKTRQTPLPPLKGRSAETTAQRPSVATQFSLILYNPNEPRVNHFHSYTHRFCPKNTDWGSTRFHGPFYRICYREPFERQALLKNDTLAFTAYIRTVDDTTGCLWEHSSDSNPWDSLAMTGLHSLSSPARGTDGNIVAAISAWMLLRPFRELLYGVQIPDPLQDARRQSMPVVEQLQSLLFQMRQSKSSRSGKISLDDLMDKLEYYGLAEPVQKMDIIEIWEVLRAKMEDELQGTPWCNSLSVIFGPAKDQIRGIPNHRVKIKGYKSLAKAVEGMDTSLIHDPPNAQVLCLELDRQTFDPESRRWKKLTDKVSLDDRVTIQGVSYILYGHISHRGELQSGSYYSTLRPLGRGGKWYRYNNRSSDCKVTCITQREAAHEEGYASKSSRDANKGVAYIAIYIREQMLEMLHRPEPDWEVPQWLRDTRHEDSSDDWDVLDLQLDEFPDAIKCLKERIKIDPPNKVHLQIIDSAAFQSSKDAGIIDLFADGSTNLTTAPLPIIEATLPATASLRVLQEHLQERLLEVRDHRQCALFIIDSRAGYVNWPQISRWPDCTDFALDLGAISRLCPEKKFWLHIIPFETIEKQDRVAEATKKAEAGTNSDSHPGNEQTAPGANGQSSSSQLEPGDPTDSHEREDSPMSDAGDQEAVPVTSSDRPVANDPVPTEPAATSQVDGAGTSSDVEATVIAAIDSVGDVPNNAENTMSLAPEATMVDVPAAPIAVPPPPPPVEVEEPPRGRKSASRLETISKIAQDLDLSTLLRVYETMRSQTIKTNIYLFLKSFDVSGQTLRHVGSYVVSSEDSLETISKLLGTDKPLDLFEETNSSCHKLRSSRTFAQEHLHDGAIIVAREQVTDPVKYLAEGRVLKGQPHGLGEHISLGNNEAYRGDFALGKRHGHGRLIFANGDVYEGSFESGMPNGKGTLIEHATGNEYTGGWKNGKRHGQGVTMWKQAEDDSGKRCVMRFLQLEWHRYERERNAWDIERAEMKAKIAKQEGESRSSKKLNDQLNRQIRMLEKALKNERAKKSAVSEGSEANEAEHEKDAKNKAAERSEANRVMEAKRALFLHQHALQVNFFQPPETLTFLFAAPNKPHNSFLDVEAGGLENDQADVEAEQLRDRSREYLRKCVNEINYLLAPPSHPPPPNLQHMAESTNLGNHADVPMSLEEVYLQQRHKGQQMQEPSLAQAAQMTNHQTGLSMMREANNQMSQQAPQMARESNQFPLSQAPSLQQEDLSQSNQGQPGLRFPTENDEQVERVTHSYDSFGRPLQTREEETNQNPQAISEEPDGWNFEEPTAPPEIQPDQPPPRRPDTDLFPSANSIPAKSPPRTGPASHRRRSSESNRLARRRSDESRESPSSHATKPDAQNFKVRFGLRGHLDVVRSVIFTGGGSPSEPEICTAGDDGLIKRWIIPAASYGNHPTSSGGGSGSSGTQAPSQSQSLSQSQALLPSSSSSTQPSATSTTSSTDLDIQPYFTHRGHTSLVTSLAACPSSSASAFSTGGRAPGDGWIFSGGADRTIRVWERGRVDPKATLEGHADAVWTVCVLPGSAGSAWGGSESGGAAARWGGGERILVASGSADGALKIWAVSAPPSAASSVGGVGGAGVGGGGGGVGGGAGGAGGAGGGSRRGVGGSRRHSVTSGSAFPSSPQPSVATATPFHYTLVHSITRLGAPSPTCISPLSPAGENFVVGFTDSSILVYDTRTGEEVIGMASTETYDGTPGTGVNAVVATSVGLEGGSMSLDQGRGMVGEDEVVHGGATGRSGEGGVEGVVISGHEDRYIRFFDANSGMWILRRCAVVWKDANDDVQVNAHTACSLTPARFLRFRSPRMAAKPSQLVTTPRFASGPWRNASALRS
ncbi:MAG: hypothetical protein Q9165_004013 [Trypethelium subeluteriae]